LTSIPFLGVKSLLGKEKRRRREKGKKKRGEEPDRLIDLADLLFLAHPVERKGKETLPKRKGSKGKEREKGKGKKKSRFETRLIFNSRYRMIGLDPFLRKRENRKEEEREEKKKERRTVAITLNLCSNTEEGKKKGKGKKKREKRRNWTTPVKPSPAPLRGSRRGSGFRGKERGKTTKGQEKKKRRNARCEVDRFRLIRPPQIVLRTKTRKREILRGGKRKKEKGKRWIRTFILIDLENPSRDVWKKKVKSREREEKEATRPLSHASFDCKRRREDKKRKSKKEKEKEKNPRLSTAM